MTAPKYTRAELLAFAAQMAPELRDPRSRKKRISTLDKEGKVVRRISDHNPDLLRYVDSLGLVPDATVKVTQRGPFDGPLYLDVIAPTDHTATPRERVIGAEIARNVFVSRPSEAPFDCL